MDNFGNRGVRVPNASPGTPLSRAAQEKRPIGIGLPNAPCRVWRPRLAVPGSPVPCLRLCVGMSGAGRQACLRGPSLAPASQRVLVTVSFVWVVEQYDLDWNPPDRVRYLQKPGSRTFRRRTLDEKEYAKIIRTTGHWIANGLVRQRTLFASACQTRVGPFPRGPREEAVQGAGMVGPFHAQGAAASDASVRLAVGANNHSPVRSPVPGTRRDRAPAEEAGIKKAKPWNRTVEKWNPEYWNNRIWERHPPMGHPSSRGWAHEGTPNASSRLGTQPPPENVASARAVLGDAGPAAGTCVASTPLNRPCAPVRGCGVDVGGNHRSVRSGVWSQPLMCNLMP